jgi:amidase
MNMSGKSEAVRGRRKFLRTGIIGAVGAAITPKLSAPARPYFEVTRRDEGANVDAARTRAIGGAPSPVASFEFDEMTIGELQDGMRSGKFTARSISERYLARIEEIDKHGP